jgi:hypothetical protein
VVAHRVDRVQVLQDLAGTLGMKPLSDLTLMRSPPAGSVSTTADAPAVSPPRPDPIKVT